MTWSIGNVWKDDEVGREDPKRKRLEREKETFKKEPMAQEQGRAGEKSER